MKPFLSFDPDPDLPPPQARDATDSRRRRDGPGTLHHVTNRGLASRSAFETEAEIRFLFSLVAWGAHRGWWRVHAYTVLHTHFHLLVTVGGQSLSRTMRWVLFRYARRFNRRRGREGPLFNSRFFSQPVRSTAYRRVVVSYIDYNPVSAGLAPHPAAYPWGSARHYRSGDGPKWLDRRLVEGFLHDSLGRTPDEEDYELVFWRRRNRSESWFVERRLQDACDSDDPLDDLLTAPTDRVRSWLSDRAKLADGRVQHPPIVTPRGIELALESARSENPDWEVRIAKKSVSGWLVLRVGLLRDMARLGAPEIAPLASMSVSMVYRRARQHRRLLATDPEYARRTALILQGALQHDHGSFERPVGDSRPVD